MSIKLNQRGEEKIQDAVFKKYGLLMESIWKREVPVFTGRYKNSITAKKQGRLNVIVGTNLEYAEKLEKGGGEGEWPEWENLKTWVRRKLGFQGEKLNAVTASIRRKIFEEGVTQNQAFMRAVKEFQQRT